MDARRSFRGGVPIRSLADRAGRHPIATVAVLSAVAALGHVVWIVTHRRVGAYDPDEAGYLATSLRYHRTLVSWHPADFLRAVGGTANGPVVPLLSTALLVLGPVDTLTAMLVQPAMLVVCACAVAWTTLRFSGPATAVVAGVAVTGFPTFVFAAQSYWYGLGAAAVTALTVVALLRSDGLTNRWTWAFGVGLALMPMTRTMAGAFVPGVVLGAVVLAWGDRRATRRLVAACVLAVAIAGPWFAVNAPAIVGYLTSYGYGERAGLFGSGDVPDRVWFRLERMSEGLGLVPPAAVLMGVATASAALRVGRRLVRSPRRREAAAVAVPVVCGLAALTSTSNNGVWFELPVLVLALPLAAAVIARSARAVRWASAAMLGVMLVMVSATTWWWIEPAHNWLAFGVTGAQYEGGFRLYDPRFGTDRRSEQADAAADWAALSDDVAARLVSIDEEVGGALFTMSGNMQLLNTNSVQLAAELRERELLFSIPDSTAPVEAISEQLSPMVSTGHHGLRRRVLVIARHRQHLFTPDADVERFVSAARAAGWKVVDAVEMPDGGVVEILRLPQRAG